MSILVKNKLEVKPDGYVQIPSLEPISSLSSMSLARWFPKNGNGMIKVADFLRCVPGSKLIRLAMPAGHLNIQWVIELPSGPPPDGFSCTCNPDWYQMLKDCVQTQPPAATPECSGFNFNPCESDIDPFREQRDPNARPNSNPLNANIDGFIGSPLMIQ